MNRVSFFNIKIVTFEKKYYKNYYWHLMKRLNVRTEPPAALNAKIPVAIVIM